MNAVPSWAAAAPAASTAATPRPVAMPPVATSGRSVTAPHELEQREQARRRRARASSNGAAVAAGLHALHHERVGAGRPRPRAASAGVVTVTQTAHPAAWSSRDAPSAPGSRT